MGRPSLAAQRREQILDAITQCIGEFGIEGTTLERVAEASGFSRGHIRHYLGNRGDMLTQFQHRLSTRYVQRMQDICDSTEPGQRGAALVRFLFGKEWGPGQDSAAINALLWAAARDENVRTGLRATYMAMERTVARGLRADFPDAPAAECASTAYALLCLAFGHSSLLELSYPAARQRTAAAVAQQILDRLASYQPPAP
ncbi:MAG TPA: TetR/AcrR family transcriptional regulator [Streptosporangiaceae bacterium]|nr:TetR/AcrR family transcriptional regulator [Streptosporangiaceae bacterium]